MKNKKVYILTETFYNYDSAEEPKTIILGVYNEQKKASEKMNQEINVNINEFDFVKDEQNNTNIIFWDYQENWTTYIEYEILKKIVE